MGFVTVQDPIYGNGSGPFDFNPAHGNCLNVPLDVFRWTSLESPCASKPHPRARRSSLGRSARRFVRRKRRDFAP